MRSKIIYLIFILLLNNILFSTEIDELLKQGNDLYFQGDIDRALDKFYEAEKLDRSDIRPKEGVYNSCIYLGKYKVANKYAKKLYRLSNSDINTDRLVYSDALLGRTGNAKKFLSLQENYERKKYLITLSGWGLFNNGYYIESTEWFGVAQKDGFVNKDVSYGYSLSKDKLRSKKKKFDISISPFSYSKDANLSGGLNLNFDYNYGYFDKRYDLNFIMQFTTMNPEREAENPDFYGDLGQYEIFWQYRNLLSSRNSFYTAGKLSFCTNDYVKYSLMGLGGARYDLMDRFIADSYISGSMIEYAYYDSLALGNEIVKQSGFIKYNEYYNSLFSLQSTTNLTYYSKYFYINGEILLSKLLGSTYFADMRSKGGRDDLPDDVVDSDEIECFYTARAGITTKQVAVFGSYSEGNNFMMHSEAGRYLNTTEFGFENSYSGGFTVNKLFDKWIMSYIFTKKNYEEYNVITNTLVASYSW
jgi:hypothetical protein